jgi:hypothetical protein
MVAALRLLRRWEGPATGRPGTGRQVRENTSSPHSEHAWSYFTRRSPIERVYGAAGRLLPRHEGRSADRPRSLASQEEDCEDKRTTEQGR